MRRAEGDNPPPHTHTPDNGLLLLKVLKCSEANKENQEMSTEVPG